MDQKGERMWMRKRTLNGRKMKLCTAVHTPFAHALSLFDGGRQYSISGNE